MNFEYKAFYQDNKEPFDERMQMGGRKIKDLVTVNITIEMEKDKYDAIRKKYSTHPAERTIKIFK